MPQNTKQNRENSLLSHWQPPQILQEPGEESNGPGPITAEWYSVEKSQCQETLHVIAATKS